ncbi:lysozyme inhibitor LprI family protein [Sulfitobacter sp. D35]|uniref:lysozyme inhibitor LprI family protein n=1 Tax=Sulfitobacter sp. D35 TaxID=3083252 RepID=UPI00296F117E|nr:lysozyme inhibitor LprI family protein [Sulfitobacter sp. D35]MDW4497334.1 lysozyme inhibitor LprI family protein [Sulfitobacter sp. D35]
MRRGPEYLAVAALAAVLLPVTGQAQDCANAVTQLDMNRCAEIEWSQADATLNQLWSQVKPQADGMGLGDQLLGAQRAWLAHRDATCAYEQATFAGGSIAPLIYWSCMRRLTEQRNADLGGLLN